MIINQKTHPHFWENHPPASPILRIMGVHVDQGKYDEFLKEAESCCPHLNEEEKKTWAAFNSMHHKGTRAGHIAEIPGTKVVRLSRWLERAIAAILIYLAVILLLLVVLVARGHAQTNQGPTPTITNLGNGHRAMDMTCPPGATCGGGGGGGTSATDNTGFTAGTSVFTPAGGVFNNVLAALSSGNWGTFRITAFRALQVTLFDSSGNEITSSNPLNVVFPSPQTVNVNNFPAGFNVNNFPSGFNVNNTPSVNQGTSPWIVAGNVASGSADSGNPVKTGGVFNTTPPTVTTGQRVDQQMTNRGETLIAKGPSGFSIDNTGFNVNNFPTGFNVNNSPAVNQAGAPWSFQGDVASGSADGGNPVKEGLQARTSLPAAVSNAQRVNRVGDKFGRAIVLPVTIRDLTSTNTVTLSSTTETTLLAAGGAGVFLDLVSLDCTNTSATLVRVDLRDATAGTIRSSWALAASGGGFVKTWNVPWPQTTANNNWTVQLSGAVTDVRCNVEAAQNQ